MSNDYPPPGSSDQPPADAPPPDYGPAPTYGQPPAYPPPGAGAPVPGGFAAPKTSPMAIVSLVLGIIGVCCGQLFVLSIGAVVTGALGRRQVKEGAGAYKGDGLAVAGLVLGVIGIVIGVAYWVLVATGVLQANFSVTS